MSTTAAAEVPAHNEPGRDPADFALTNKMMVACHICRLVKSRNQFYSDGCDNCKNILGGGISFEDYTTPNFTGVISVVDPKTSWASKWLHLSKCVPGCYAMAINEDMNDELQDLLENKNVKIRR